MIQPQFLNLLNSSFVLFLEHSILEKGQSYTTGVSSKYYPIGRTYNNYYVYGSPVQPQVADASITVPMTGIYINGTFYQRGVTPFVDIDYKNNRVILSSQANNVSGYFPLSDINILPLDVSEEKLLFETKFNLKNQSTNNITNFTGINNDEKTYPAIYYKSESMTNKPFAFGGVDESEVNVGLFLIMESKYQLDALCSILADFNKKNFALLTSDKMPYNYLGGFKETGSNFNYSILNTTYLSNNSGIYIKDVTINNSNRFYNADSNKLNPDVHFAVAQFDLCKPRLPRSNTNNL
jgi:hypothetical protein